MIEFGVWIPTCRQLATPDIIRRAVVRAEQLGYESVWVSDHVVVPNAHLERFGAAIYDPLITLAVAAGATSRVRLGTTVLIVPYRNAVVTAKMVSSLDALSGGRFVLGVGAGWVAEERRHRMLITRRDVGRIALAAGAGSRLMAAKPDSVFGGVRIGTITYSFRSLPSSADEVLKYCLDCGISGIELMSNVAEGYAGAPASGGRGGFGPGGRAQMTPEQQAAMQKAAEETKNWRLSVSMDKYKAFRKIEKAKAQLGAKVEHPFRVIKRQFGYTRVRFRGLAKNAAQKVTLFALSNLWMARRHLLASAGEVRL